MVNATLLVTQDYYLFQGIKNCLPETLQLRTVDRRIFSSGYQEYSLLVDSRLPLFFWQNIVISADKTGARIRCIILDMRHSEIPPLRLKQSLDMSIPYREIEAILTQLRRIKPEVAAKEWFREMRLSGEERAMMRLLRMGMPMEQAAVKLNTSLKSLYRRRIELYQRLGLASFNEACLLIFRNEPPDYP